MPAFVEEARPISERLSAGESRVVKFEKVVKPLFVYREEEEGVCYRGSLKRVKNDGEQLADLVSQLRLDDRGYCPALPEKQRAGRSSSDIQNKVSYTAHKSKMKKLAKQY